MRPDINVQKSWADEFELVATNGNPQPYKMERKEFATRKPWW